MEVAYYREYYYLERNHWWFKAREAILAAMIERYADLGQSSDILNVGAATGRSSEMLARFGRVTSLEYNEECCEFVRRELDMEIIQGSALDLPFEDRSFDLVTAFDVVEHIERDRDAVNELIRVCRPGGYVFITVPAFRFLWSSHDEVNHHFRRYRGQEIRALFPGNGKMVSSSYFNSILFPPIAFYRLLSSLFSGKKSGRKDLDSDFTVMDRGTMLQEALYRIFLFERRLLTSGIRFPFGVSYLYMWQKN